MGSELSAANPAVAYAALIAAAQVIDLSFIYFPRLMIRFVCTHDRLASTLAKNLSNLANFYENPRHFAKIRDIH